MSKILSDEEGEGRVSYEEDDDNLVDLDEARIARGFVCPVCYEFTEDSDVCADDCEEDNDPVNACALPPDAARIARQQISLILDHEGEPPLWTGPCPAWKHKCYAMALRFFAEHETALATQNPGTTVIVALVHGFPYINRPGHPDHGTRFGHAWVEVTFSIPVPPIYCESWGDINTVVMCWCPATGALFSLPVYYAEGRIDPDACERWTDPVVVAAKLMDDASDLTGHVGNWAAYAHMNPLPVWTDNE